MVLSFSLRCSHSGRGKSGFGNGVCSPGSRVVHGLTSIHFRAKPAMLPYSMQR